MTTAGPDAVDRERVAALAARLLDAPFAAVVVGVGAAARVAASYAVDGFDERFPWSAALAVAAEVERGRRRASIALDDLTGGAGGASCAPAPRSAVAVPAPHPRGAPVTLCVIDTRPRRWSVQEIEALVDLAAVATRPAPVLVTAPCTPDFAALTQARRAGQELAAHDDHQRLLHEVTVHAIHARGREALAHGLERICATFGWRAPAIHPSSALASGVIAEVAATGRPAWSSGVDGASSADRRRAGRDVGARTTLAFPLARDGRTVAVLEVFSLETERPGAARIAILRDVGRVLGGMLEAEPAPSRRTRERARRVATRRPPRPSVPPPTSHLRAPSAAPRR